MINEELPLIAKSLEQLLDDLAVTEDAQIKIYAIYNRAAEVDEEMRKLKNRERDIRRFISMKIGAS